MGSHALRNTLSMFLCFFSLVFFIGVHNLISEDGQFVALLSSKLFWIVLALEVPVIFIKRHNYRCNYKSVTSISGAMQLSFIFLPLAAFLITELMGFRSSIPTIFDTKSDMFIYSVGITLSLVVYLRSKIQLAKVNSIFFLLLTPAWMSLSGYAFITLLQTESLVAPFVVITAINCIIFFVLSCRHGEFDRMTRSDAKDISLEVMKMLPGKPMVLWLSATLSAELFMIGRRLAQLITGVIVDYRESGNISQTKNDVIFVIFVVLYTGLWFF